MGELDRDFGEVNPENWSFAKMLIVLGLGLGALGGAWLLFERLGIPLGRLPGDIHIEGKRGSFHFPIVTCIVVSVLGSLLLRWFSRY